MESLSDFRRIEDYGIIGNLETCAHVGDDDQVLNPGSGLVV
ncbi:MAG: hypothetical protein ACLGPL_10650 [Acidobacteriota bacterium]